MNFLICLIIFFCVYYIIQRISEIIKENKENNSLKKIKNVASYSLTEVIMALYIIIYEGLVMIFVTGLFIYHTKLVLKNMTTKEDIKKFWENPQGNPYFRTDKNINIKNSLFPTKQKKSIIDIFKEGYNNNGDDKEKEEEEIKVEVEPKDDENNGEKLISQENNTNNNKNNNQNNSPAKNIHERGNTTYNKIEQSTGITGNKIHILENKENNSDFISEKLEESKTNQNKNNNSIKSFDINIELNEEKIIKNNGIKNIDMNERYSQSMLNMRRSSIRISDCSENITEASGEKREQFFQSNFENGIHNMKLKPIREGNN